MKIHDKPGNALGTVAALLEAVRGGQRVKLSRGAENVAVVVPQAEYQRLVDASGRGDEPEVQFPAAFRGWKASVALVDLIGGPQFLHDLRSGRS